MDPEFHVPIKMSPILVSDVISIEKANGQRPGSTFQSPRYTTTGILGFLILCEVVDTGGGISSVPIEHWSRAEGGSSVFAFLFLGLDGAIVQCVHSLPQD